VIQEKPSSFSTRSGYSWQHLHSLAVVIGLQLLHSHLKKRQLMSINTEKQLKTLIPKRFYAITRDLRLDCINMQLP
jgi:hypothetical protein